MTELETAIGRFLTLIAETPNLWKSVDIRVLAVQSGDKHHSLLCTSRLDSRPVARLERIKNLPGSPPVSCFQLKLPLDRITDLFSQLQSGIIYFADTPVSFTQKGYAKEGAREPYSSAYTSRSSPLQQLADGSLFNIGHTFVATGETAHHVVQQLDDGLDGLNNAVRRLRFPWDGVDGIARHLLHTNSRVSHHRATVFELFAPLEARIDRDASRLETGVLTCAVVGSPAAVRYTRLGYFGVNHSGGIVNGELALSGRALKRMGSVMRWSGKLRIPNVHRVSIFLTVAESNVDRAELVDISARGQNERVLAYALTDPSLAILRTQLQLGSAAEARIYEKNVTRLFAFGGYITDGYAFEKHLTHGPDALAFAPDGTSVLVLECTTGPLASRSGKLSQLVSRATRIRERLSRAGSPIVLPVIVTALPRAELAEAELMDAATDRVSVLAQEDIQDLLDLVIGQIMPTDVLNFCRARVPMQPSDHPTPLFGGLS
jgi:hypothetical protein